MNLPAFATALSIAVGRCTFLGQESCKCADLPPVCSTNLHRVYGCTCLQTARSELLALLEKPSLRGIPLLVLVRHWDSLQSEVLWLGLWRAGIQLVGITGSAPD
jgi:hypothetical protein